MSFQGKVCWVTGASSGIGEGMCYELSKKGAAIILSARRKEQLEKVRQECERLGAATCSVIPLDLASEDSIVSALDKVLKIHDRIDYLFNNGGISQRGSISDSTDIESDRKIMEVNFFGTISLSKKVLPIMLSNGFGHFVVTSSIVGKFGFPLRSTYSASKHALHGYFETMRIENAKKGIRVSMVLPGRVATDISLSAIDASGKTHGEMDEGLAAGIPVAECARQIIKGVEANKREILAGGKELMMVHIRRFLPSLFYKLAAKIKPT